MAKIAFTPANIKELTKRIQEKAMQLAGKEALSNAITNMRKVATMDINKAVTLKSGDIKDALDIKKPKIGPLDKMKASLDVAAKSVSLYKYGARTKQVRRKGTSSLTAVSVKVKRTGPRKVVQGGFVAAQRGSGLPAIFKRQGKSRLPLEKLWSTSVRDIFRSGSFRNDLMLRARGVMQTVYKRALIFRVNQEMQKRFPDQVK